MLGRHVYRVHPDAGEWIVSKDGEDRPRGKFATREEAVGEVVRLAHADQPARVVIDNDDGSIAEERLFGLEPSDELRP